MADAAWRAIACCASLTTMQPLARVLVLDFTTLLPGPLATLLLAEVGAEVIKIERPGGEDMRRYEPRFDGESAMFALLNRGKTSLVLDLKSATDRDKLTPLIKRADVLVEQFRPGDGNVSGHGWRAADRRLAAVSALSDQRRQARLLRGAGAAILGAVHRHDRACRPVHRRQPRSGSDQGRGRRHHRRPERGRMAAAVRRRGLLRHHHGDAGRG